jgi:hypothetical protein
MLALPISTEGVKPILRRSLEIIERCRRIKVLQLASGPPAKNLAGTG